MRFDRILCDVPCGGDGTLRKSPSKFGKWGVRTGLRTHPLQLAILLRGLRLLKPGGRLVYSTCALDPLQNEAVVLAALQADPGVELLSAEDAMEASDLHGLRYRQGLGKWRVPAPDFETSRRTFGALEDVPREWRQSPPSTAGAPSSGGNGSDAAEPALTGSMFCTGAEPHALERCVRLLPTHGDEFGGFFVACLVRKREAEAEAEAEAGAEGEVGANPGAGAEMEALAPAAPVLAPSEPALAAAAREAYEVLEGFFGVDARDASRLCLATLAAPGSFAACGPSQPRPSPGPGGGAAGGAAAAAARANADATLVSVVPPSSLRLVPSASTRLLAAGQPLLARLPGGAAGWWPVERRPWCVCQEGASLIASLATRRRLVVRDVATAKALLAQRRTPRAELRRLAACGALEGLSTCEPAPRHAPACAPPLAAAAASAAGGADSVVADGEAGLEAGAAVLVLPCASGGHGERASHEQQQQQQQSEPPLAVAALIDTSGALLLLASDDLLERFAQRMPPL